MTKLISDSSEVLYEFFLPSMHLLLNSFKFGYILDFEKSECFHKNHNFGAFTTKLLTDTWQILPLNFYTSEVCIMVSKFTNFSPQIDLKNFCRLFRPSGLRNDQWQKIFWVCESVTKTKLEPFLYLNIFQSALNLVHMFIDTVPLDCFF